MVLLWSRGLMGCELGGKMLAVETDGGWMLEWAVRMLEMVWNDV